MIALSSIDELQDAQIEIEKMKKDYPVLFEKLLEVIYLTRALQYKYQYMGHLIMDEYPGEAAPKFAYDSVQRIYKSEMQKLKANHDFRVLKQVMVKFSNLNYSKIFLLAIGQKPESLVGSSYIK
ncbi:hypothetical protein [Cytobacillus purgationiresistens]|uniref:Uncharacterized protein n=1 Tax=Cytobacillus purgationiresistens TaxID=863449 RepID=A0ABU0AMM3_9BACI|nr:hypothetical protein [Cytobacillus purgationiresistens]MDQ0272519.1 hypothetical protein [Cytobacillus purgationiresistens]